MVHDCNYRGKNQEQVVKMNQNSGMKIMEANILGSLNSLKNEILNAKQITIRNLQNDTAKPKTECDRMERRCEKNEAEHNALAQYGCHNNVILSDTSDSVSDDTLQ